ncbi:MAG: tyrosine-type recombinase/integrase [Geminicoccaceae bacterium]
MSEMRLYDTDGRRLYLNAEERAVFLAAAAAAPPRTRLFAETLHYTGCRLSEALALTPERVDLSEGRIIFNSLKKRREDVYRSVPVPSEYLTRLDLTFGLRQAQKRQKVKAERLWTWSRVRGWQIVKGIMEGADIADGPHRTPKGLRHAYGINAIGKGVPLNILQKWLGHAQLTTTAIYANASGKEESELASWMWDQ